MQVCGCSGVAVRNSDLHTDRLHTQVNEVEHRVYARAARVVLKSDAIIRKGALGAKISFQESHCIISR